MNHSRIKVLGQIGGMGWAALACSAALAFGGCGRNSDPSSATEDESTSGTALAAVGGALSGSGSSSSLAALQLQMTMTMTTSTSLSQASFSSWASIRTAFDFMPEAFAATSCPTFRFPSGSSCSASGGTMWLTYSGCSFGGSATWTGAQALILSSGSASCGTFPSHAGAAHTLTRQFVASSGSSTPGAITIASAFGTQATIDHSTADLANFDNQTISTIANGGYGAQVSFDASGKRTQVTVRHRLRIGGALGLDHSLDGTLSVSEASGGATSRTVNGTLKTYHNRLQVVGTTTLRDVTHSDSCCQPTSGTITTAFAAGANVAPTSIGSAYVGKSETLVITGCGTATLTKASGETIDVALSRCF